MKKLIMIMMAASLIANCVGEAGKQIELPEYGNRQGEKDSNGEAVGDHQGISHESATGDTSDIDKSQMAVKIMKENIKAGKYIIKPRGVLTGHITISAGSSWNNETSEPEMKIITRGKPAEKPDNNGNGNVIKNETAPPGQTKPDPSPENNSPVNNGQPESPSGQKSGPVSDGDVDEIWINIKEIQLVSEEEGVITIPSNIGSFDLLKIKDDATALFTDADLPQGFYDQMRLILDEPNGKVVVNGEEHDLKVPSGEQTGLKLEGNIDIISGLIEEMTLDFQIHGLKYNKGQGYILRPVVAIKEMRSIPPFSLGYLFIKLKEKIEIVQDDQGNMTLTGIPSIDAINAKYRVVNIEKFLETAGFADFEPEMIQEMGVDRVYLFVFKQDTDILMAWADYIEDANVEHSFPDLIMAMDQAAPPQRIPNDCEAHNRHMADPGCNGITTAEQEVYLNDINAFDAWNLTTGESTTGTPVKVAVIDCGVFNEHEDLSVSYGRSFYWGKCGKKKCFQTTNPGERPYTISDHGTHVAGIIGARTDNGRGVAGINWHADVMSIDVCNNDNENDIDCGVDNAGNPYPACNVRSISGTSSTLASGIFEAIWKKNKVINISMGGYGSEVCWDKNGNLDYSKCVFTHPDEFNAVGAAYRSDVVVVASAGNDKQEVYPYKGTPHDPAHYPSSFPGVISVGALNTGAFL